MIVHLIQKEEAERIVNDEHNDWEVVDTTIIGKARWSIRYRGIYKYIPTEKFYRVEYSLGATELQDDQELFYGDNIEFIEVIQYEVTVKQWVVKE